MIEILQDSFTDTNGVLAEAHVPDEVLLGSYSVDRAFSADPAPASANLTIQSNRLQIAASGHLLFFDPGPGDGEFRFKWVIGAASGARLHIAVRRASFNESHYWNLREPNGDINFYDVTGGAQTSLYSSAYAWSLNTTYDIRVTYSGNQSSLYVNGALIQTVTMTSNLTATGIGLGTATISVPAVYDDLVVDSEGGVSFQDSTVALGDTAGAAAPGTEDATISPALASAVTGATVRGSALAVSNLSTSGARITAPDISECSPGGLLETVRLNVEQPVALTSGAETVFGGLTFTPPSTAQLGTLGAGPYTTYVPANASQGDDVLIYWDAGEGTVTDLATGDAQPGGVGPVARLVVAVFDISAGAWLRKVTEFAIPQAASAVQSRRSKVFGLGLSLRI